MFLRDKLVILVTHQVQFALQCDQVLGLKEVQCTAKFTTIIMCDTRCAFVESQQIISCMKMLFIRTYVHVYREG